MPSDCGAGHAEAGGGDGVESFGGDGRAAGLAPPVRSGAHPLEGSVDLVDLCFGLAEERGLLLSFERDRVAFGIVLVVGGDIGGGVDDVLERGSERRDDSGQSLPLSAERAVVGRRTQSSTSMKMHSPGHSSADSIADSTRFSGTVA